MSHEVQLYYPEAPLGSFSVRLHGQASSNPDTFEDFDCTLPTTNRQLSSSGRALFFVRDIVDVDVRRSDASLVESRVFGVRAEAVAVQSVSFDGTLDNGGSGPEGLVFLKEILKSVLHSFGARNFLVRETGTNTDLRLKDALAAVRSVNNRVFNVKQPPFNAVGDGVTLDDAAVQGAYAALVANGGGSLYFPAGTYLVSQTLATGTVGLTILGDGMDASRIKSTNGVAAITISGSGAAKAVGLRDIAVETTSLTADLVNADAIGSSILFCRFVGPSGGNNPIRWRSDGVIAFNRLFTSTTGTTGKVDITDAPYNPQDIQIANNLFNGPTAAAPHINVAGLVQLIVSGNVFNGETNNYIVINSSIQSGADITVTGNSVSFPISSQDFIEVQAACQVMESGNILQSSSSAAFCNPINTTSVLSSGITSKSLQPKRDLGTGAALTPIFGVKLNTFTANANFTLNAPMLSNGATPANPFAGAEMYTQIHNSTGGAITVTLNTAYHGANTNIAAGTTRVYRWVYSLGGTVTGWIQQGAVQDVT
jgi:hypothetical protein